MHSLTLKKKRSARLEPVEIVPQGSVLKVSAAASNTGAVFIARSKRGCHKNAILLEPGSWIELTVDSTGRVFARGSKDGQIVCFSVGPSDTRYG